MQIFQPALDCTLSWYSAPCTDSFIICVCAAGTFMMNVQSPTVLVQITRVLWSAN